MALDESYNPSAEALPAPPLLHPLIRFVVAGFWAAAVFWGSGFVYLFFPRHNLIPSLLFRVLACILTLAGFAFFIRVLDFNSAPLAAALGLPLDRTASRQLGAGLGLGATMIVIGVAAIACFGSLQLHLRHGHLLLLRAVVVTATLLLAALMEELAFRGYPFQKLTQAFGAFGAVLVLSALFGAVHLWNPEAPGLLSWGFFNTLFVGVLFALARIRTGSLWFSIGLHFGWNFFQGAVFGLAVSGLREFATFAYANVHGSNALTGGAYGLEASATCTLVLVAALPLLWWITAQPSFQHRPPRPISQHGI
jgi:hypothetical protein